ncbi:hypothetical protein AQUCO_04200129v1 [Aquilegia coerulea]|uniref:Uncharacterized protein n=1 Tax=Aquilegia coerulea TaxID=218851 RepID=A0A2G5CPC1_AQUCA|nr:hypothetical protein AQUCO_04200129v1 [Aquilegia coerulea]
MGKLLNLYDKQSMKMAMLRHEETFKEQVFELHRLYQVQKMLMKCIKSDRACRRQQERWNFENENYVTEANYINQEQQKLQRKLDLEQPAKDYMNEDGDGVVEIEDENDIELTLGPANKYLRRKRDEMPIISDVGPSFSSSSTESNFVQRTSTTNTSNRENRREELTDQWGLIQVPNIHSKFQNGKKAFEVEEQMKQERLNHPPWLLQVLSLKMT